MNKRKIKQPVQTKFHVRSGDLVRVISGAFRGVEGRISRVIRKRSRVIVEGVPTLKKSVRPGQQNPEGGYIDIERSIHISNVKKLNADDAGKKPAKETAAKKTTRKSTTKKDA